MRLITNAAGASADRTGTSAYGRQIGPSGGASDIGQSKGYIGEKWDGSFRAADSRRA